MVASGNNLKNIDKIIEKKIPIVSFLWVEDCGNSLEEKSFEDYLISPQTIELDKPLLNFK